MAVEIVIPVLGVTVPTGTVLEWRKKEGDRVAKGDVIFVVVTEDVPTEIKSPASGTLARILVAGRRRSPGPDRGRPDHSSRRIHADRLQSSPG